MKIIKKIWQLTVVALMLSLAACTPDSGTDNVPDGAFIFEENTTTFNLTEEEQIIFIGVKTNIPATDWTITYEDEEAAEWCKISKSYDVAKGFYLAVSANEETDLRRVNIKIKAGSNTPTLRVAQLGLGPAILVNDATVAQGGGDVTLTVTSNIDVAVSSPVFEEGETIDWLTVENNGQPVSRALADRRFEMKADLNDRPYVREAYLRVYSTEPQYRPTSLVPGTEDEDGVYVDVLIRQATGTVTTETKLPDDMIEILSGEANQAHGASPITNLFDGDTTSDSDNLIYHSPWAADEWTDETGAEVTGTKFPVTWTFNFAGDSDIDYFRLYSRSGNGRVGTFNVEYKSAGDSAWTLMTAADGTVPTEEAPLFDFEQKGGLQYCYFPEAVKNASSIRLSFYSGAGDLVSGREIQFFKSNSEARNAEILKVFTDMSCSELKEGVGRAEITELFRTVPYLAQEVAMKLLDGTYPEAEKEFRIHDYEAYSNGEVLYQQLLTKRYTQQDNPTGIYVNNNAKLLVCVGKLPAGHTVELGISGEMGDGYSTRYNGFGQRIQLIEGLNEITTSAEGMCFVLNTTNNLTETSEPVRVHILPGSGRVDGYFDIARHNDDDYVKLLAGTQGKYFYAKGQNMIFEMHTSVLRTHASNGIISGLSAWDNILGWQLELMGLAKDVNGDGSEWDRMISKTGFNNHMVAISTTNPTAYMDASEYRISFSATSGIPKIISYELLNAEEDNTWGPAHEAGHVNQGAINWKSTTESSNNLFSNYAIYKMGKYTSRGQTIAYLAECFAKNEQWALLGSSTHMNEDTEVHMRMNWQLWNYFHRCGVDPEFFPRLFALLRTDEYHLPGEFAYVWGESENPGQCQMNYAKAVCAAARMDFTDFFEVWGFWRTIDVNYEQYGTARYNVTDKMISDTKEWIAAQGWPKAPAMQYIEDRKTKNGEQYAELGYYETFRDKLTVPKNLTYTVTGRHYLVKGADNAVAIEVRGADDKLLYFSNMQGFDVPSNVTLNNEKVVAVQWDGERIECKKQ